MIYFIYMILLYTILWFKGNAKILYGIELAPWQWWLYTGLFTNYFGLTVWWHLIDKHEIWGAIAISYCMHSIVELGLSFYFYSPPTNQQIIGLSLIITGGFLILK